MASTNALAIQGTVTFPPDEGQAAVAVQFGLSSNYQSVLDSRLVMVGSGSQAVPFGSIIAPGAKAALIEYENVVGAAVISLRFNAGVENFELSPGGFLIWGSPNPTVGITAITIVRTTDAVVRVRLFG